MSKPKPKHSFKQEGITLRQMPENYVLAVWNGAHWTCEPDLAVHRVTATAVFRFLMLDIDNKYTNIVNLTQLEKDINTAHKLFGAHRKNVFLQFVGIDSWNRPIFKDVLTASYYGSTNKLFCSTALESEVLRVISIDDITWFGRYFGCEPAGTPKHPDANWFIVQVK